MSLSRNTRVLSRLVSTSTTASSSSTRPPTFLVGSPDVISNLRPVIYDGVWFKAISTPQDPSSSSSSLPLTTIVHPDKGTQHPYALNEFASTQGHESDRFFEEKKSWELRLRLERQSNDAFNHAFWTDTNSRFNTYKTFVGTSTASSPEYLEASPEVKGMIMDERIAAFYRLWLDSEGKRQRAYMKEMYRRTFSLLLLEAKLKLQNLRWAVRSAMTKNLL
ncbi:hypothetical protein FRB94_007788 [Tulasnella sp. JGI-2019a]|nr:hypothetical protein FRB93_006805 [Tulasnella sp. JGI-2019a]KAG8997258.1 hypothetical protein FRB94_007788 [Tulasnella sp. JGI-2019a]KAG9028188.1 hypothetical protein FRB95_006766 [Tulasnella sp. JGI-2019a]